LNTFAISSGAYRRYKLTEAVRHVALAGYDGIEVVADIPHGYPPALDKSGRDELRAELARRKLAVSNVNAGPMTAIRDAVRPSWIEADRVLRAERVQHTLDAGELAIDLGAPTVSTIGGGPTDEVDPDDALRYFRDGLREIAQAAAKDKCPPLLICPQPDLLIRTAEDALRILEAVDDEEVGAEINTGHCLRAGEDPAAVVLRLGPALRHVHLRDVDDDGTVVVPGTGLVDFPAVFAALHEAEYDGWLTVDLSGTEVHPDDAARRALDFLKPSDS